jgi:hypothetical protein
MTSYKNKIALTALGIYSALIVGCSEKNIYSGNSLHQPGMSIAHDPGESIRDYRKRMNVPPAAIKGQVPYPHWGHEMRYSPWGGGHAIAVEAHPGYKSLVDIMGHEFTCGPKKGDGKGRHYIRGSVADARSGKSIQHEPRLGGFAGREPVHKGYRGNLDQNVLSGRRF